MTQTTSEPILKNEQFHISAFGGNAIVGAPANVSIFDSNNGHRIAVFERDGLANNTTAAAILEKFTRNFNAKNAVSAEAPVPTDQKSLEQAAAVTNALQYV